MVVHSLVIYPSHGCTNSPTCGVSKELILGSDPPAKSKATPQRWTTRLFHLKIRTRGAALSKLLLQAFGVQQ